ncbi:hypothetical protein COCHEDRAFT_1193397 [Bipolaris maydis C5]|uniref:F-box domain-containing protein n=1 Tax=Cochliobolus heterostrophus (strain C5 / ATCC 48332 / race O) TaxID=701091 RepID=M2UZ34_COCH5|nr:hypothetical protein COCHEDRAFT_1193397 [Bipolaris maydis C5]KAJ6208097.1 hypothetical protein PSV09DRAFT_1193397 [Bipolaris maydis]
MSSDATSFHGLPAELMRDICDFLPLDALLALKLTAPRLNSTIRLDPRRRQDALSPCARRAIHSYLNPSLSKPDQQHCRLCNTAYSMAMFSSSASPACIPMKLTTTPHDVVQLPSNVCSWHDTAAETNGLVAWTTCVCIVETSWAGPGAAAHAIVVASGQFAPILAISTTAKNAIGSSSGEKLQSWLIVPPVRYGSGKPI